MYPQALSRVKRSAPEKKLRAGHSKSKEIYNGFVRLARAAESTYVVGVARGICRNLHTTTPQSELRRTNSDTITHRHCCPARRPAIPVLASSAFASLHSSPFLEGNWRAWRPGRGEAPATAEALHVSSGQHISAVASGQHVSAVGSIYHQWAACAWSVLAILSAARGRTLANCSCRLSPRHGSTDGA